MVVFMTSESKKLSNIELSLEKSINAFIERSKNMDHYQIHTLWSSLENDRKAESLSLQDSINMIVVPLKNSKKMVQETGLDDSLDLKKLKKDLMQVQENIDKLKVKTRNEIKVLRNEETFLNGEVDSFNALLTSWEEPHISKQTKKAKKKEVNDFLEFVKSSGGHENGWSQDDHIAFTRVYQNHSDKEDIVKRIQKSLPIISEEKIIKHINWYKKYLHLKNLRDNALKKWREKRSSISLDSTGSTKRLEDKQEKARRLKKELILKWKIQKKESEIAQQLVKEMIENQIREKEQIRRKKNEELKQIIEQWKIKRQSDEVDYLTLEREQKEKSKRALKMIKFYQQQDVAYINRMREINKKKLEKPKIKKPKILSTKSKRNPGRLFWPTKTYTNNIKARLESNKILYTDISNTLKKKKPDWRRSVRA